MHLTLILSLISGLKSCQVDYVSAYTQAPLDCEIFMNSPPGFIAKNITLIFTTSSTPGKSTKHVLHLKKNIYGLHQAGNNWFDHLRSSLLVRSFTQSLIDPCLFMRKDCVLIVNVDHCLLFAKTDTILDHIIASLRSDFNLTSQGDVGAFLGIDIRHSANGYLELIQSGLIQKIISTCSLESESNEHKTPATQILHANLNGPPCDQPWNYCTVIGMLTYLSTSTHPDITFAIHQCARFSTHPQRLHELAVRHIILYLKGTQTKGYILRPLQS